MRPNQISQQEREPNPGVDVGDHIYVQHRGQHCVGVVCAHGKHGATVEIDGKHHKIKWKGVLGHKKRAQANYNVVDEGEDGMLVEDAHGKRKFIATPNDAKEDPMVAKSFGRRPVALFMKGIAPRPGLTEKKLTDKRGVQTTRYVRTNKDDPQDKRGSVHGYGTHNLEVGDRVSFALGDLKGEGGITSVGQDGVTAKDSSGHMHKVRWDQISGHEPKPGTKKPEHERPVLGKQEPIPADKFDAATYAKSHDKADVTPEDILAHFPEDTADKIAEVQERLKKIEQTIDTFKGADGKYVPERLALHDKIKNELLSDERIKAATPAGGEAPTFIILGGRGGSGKSWFEGNVYDPDKAIVLDANHIKGKLPEYEGWNAAAVHEESGEIFDDLVASARALGLNVVLDKTMKTAKSAIVDVKAFKDAGYRTEAHYMHLPRQEAAKRAVARFLGKTKRYVPVEVVLSNTTNEAAFDQVKHLVDDWSFRDNNVGKDEKPIMISQKTSTNEKPLIKSDQSNIILFWRLK